MIVKIFLIIISLLFISLGISFLVWAFIEQMKQSKRTTIDNNDLNEKNI